MAQRSMSHNSTTIDPLANDTDVEGDALAVIVTRQPASATLEIPSDRTLTYTPDPDFCGADAYTYVVADGTGLTSPPVGVDVTVTCLNDAPVAAANSYSVDQNSTITVPDPGLLGNDRDVDGDVVVAGVVSGPANGTVIVESGGGFTYTPDPGRYGLDTFTYEAIDPAGAADEATVSIRVRSRTVLDASAELNVGIFSSSADVFRFS